MSNLPDLPAGFDPIAYLELNPDVQEAGADPFQHWLQFGRYENRPYSRAVGEDRLITVPQEWSGDAPVGKGVKVLNFCSAHTDAYFPLHDDIIVCEMAPKGTLNAPGPVLNCEELLPEYRVYKPYLGVVYGLFTANAHLKDLSLAPHTAVNFMTYRVFTLPFATRVMDKKLNMNLIRADEAAALQRLIAPTEAKYPWMLPHPFLIDSIEAQYRSNHISADLSGFVECAVAEGVLTRDDVEACLRNIIYLPTAGSGRMPARVFCDVTDKMETLTRSFLRRATLTGRDSYQIRFVQFCYERVMNYLVEQEIRKETGVLDKRHFGHWTLVSENYHYQPGLVDGSSEQRHLLE